MEAKIGQRYRHYKNNKEYIVKAFGIHTETMEELVIYEGQYRDEIYGENPVWARPRRMFEEEVLVDGEKRDRFTAI